MMLWGEHIYTYDYNVYLSKMKQGAQGRWSVVDKYDNHIQQKGVFLQMLYLLSGKIGSLIRLSLPLTFHLLRTVLSFSWILTIIYLNVLFLKKPKYYVPGVMLSLLSASFPVFYQYNNGWWMTYHMSWWTEMDPLKRISYIPHYTLNYIIIAFLSVMLYKLTSEKIIKNKYFLYICIILFLSFFIHPSSGMLFFFSWFLFHLIQFLWHPRSYSKNLPSIIVKTVILLMVALIPLLYIRSITATYPWKSLTDFDTYNRIGVDVWEYILSLGPIFFTGMLGFVAVMIRREKKLLPFVTWLMGAFLGIYIFKKFPLQSELRFVQTANHIPLAILSVYFFATLWERFKNKLVLFASIVIFVAITLLGMALSYFSIKAQTDFIHQRAVATQPLVPYPPQIMYPLKDYWQAIEYLGNNTSPDSVVLSEVNAGNYIPAYAGNFVYIGHNPETPHYDDRLNTVNQFFTGMWTDAEAKNFLNNEHISYIFYGPQEKEKSQEDIKKYLFLKPVFTSAYVTLFKVE